jgi:hypothetical protein
LNLGLSKSWSVFRSFDRSEPKVHAITDLFGKQMEWMQPESCIADGDTGLTFVYPH